MSKNLSIHHNLYRFICFVCLFSGIALMLNGCKEEKHVNKYTKYVFLFISDGISYPQRQLTEIAAQEPLFVNTLPVQGSISVAAMDSALPDAAAAASAIATGSKVPNGAISMIPEEEKHLPSLTSLALENGFAVGIVTDGTLDSAGPAAFYAHAEKKHSYYDIATQLKDSKISALAGMEFKRPKAFKKEDLDVVLRQGGYKLIPTKNIVDFPAGKSIVTYKNIPYAIDAGKNAPNLAEFVKKSITKLSSNSGFVLVVNAEKAGTAAEMHDTATLIKEIRAFDEAVKVAYDFYQTHPEDTLVIVAGTTETGALILGGNGAENINTSVFENQKESAEAFKVAINRFRRRRPEGATIENFMPQIEKSFGLRILAKAVKQELEEKAKEGDEKAIKALSMNLDASELSFLREAYRYSMMDHSKRPKTTAYRNKFGSFDPLQIAPVQILAQRAGIDYGTFGPTAMPVPVSVIGHGSYFFAGIYPQTALFGKILTAIGITPPVAVTEIPTEEEAPAEEPTVSEMPAAETKPNTNTNTDSKTKTAAPK